MIWAICTTAFFGFFRLGELLLTKSSDFCPHRHLAWGDVAVDSNENPTMIRINLRCSKTDQFGRGASIVLGRTEVDLCPVAAIMSYLAARGEQPGPLFLTTSKVPATKQYFTGQLREVLRTLGLPDDQYAGHSFRIGAATSAACAGVQDSTIQILGRWQSAVFMAYIKTPQDRLAALSRTLARHHHQTQQVNGRDRTP